MRIPGRGRRRIAAQHRLIVVTVLTLAVVGSLAPAAFADTYSTGSSGVCVGTNGSDAVSGGDCGLYPAVAVSQGGCAQGTQVAVAVGESGRCSNGAEASSQVAVGLLGADVMPWSCCGPSFGVSDSGYVYSYNSTGSYAVSGTGEAAASEGAVSGTNNAWGDTAVSGTGTATGTTAVSGTGTATGLTAVSGTGDASSSCQTVAGASVGPAVSGTGYAEGCQSASGALTWVDTPDGPVGVGAGIKTVEIVAKEIVAGVEDVLQGTTAVGAGVAHSLPPVPTVNPPDPTDVDPTHPEDVPYTAGDWVPSTDLIGVGTAGSAGGGCPSNTSCDRIHVKDAQSLPIDVWKDYIHMYEGILVGSYLIPNSPSNDGYNWDSFHIFTTLTGYGAGICGLSNWVSSDGGTDAFYSMQPTGSRDVGDNSSQGFGLSVGPFSYSTSWSSRSGRIQGVFNTGDARATGSWTYRRDVCPHDGQNGASAAMISGASYRWPRNVSRSYNFGLRYVYQDLTQ